MIGISAVIQNLCFVGGPGSLGTDMMGLGGSGILSGGGGGVSASPGMMGSSGGGSSGLMAGLSANVLDSLGNNRMFSSGGSMDRGAGFANLLDERGGGMESRMSGGGNMYGSSGGGGGRLSFDRAMDYDHGRASSLDYDRGDRGGSDPYGRSDTCTVFVRNVSCLQYLTIVFLTPNAYRPAGDVSFTVSVFVCLLVLRFFVMDISSMG